eukprot:EG_transcript_9520
MDAPSEEAPLPVPVGPPALEELLPSSSSSSLPFISRPLPSGGSSPSDGDEIYRWSPIPLEAPSALPGVSGHSAVVHGGRCVLFGGIADCEPYCRDVWVYDFLTGRCQRVDCTGVAPPGVFGHSATVVPGPRDVPLAASASMIVHGGKLDVSHVSSQTFALDLYATGFQWRQVRRSWRGVIPPPRWGHTALLLPSLPGTPVWAAMGTQGPGARLLIFGGDGGNQMKNDLMLFDPGTAIWTPLETMGQRVPCPRRKHCAGIHGAAMFVFGGRAENRCLQDVWCLQLDTLVWQEVETTGSIPHVRTGHSCVWHAGRMMVFGGFDYGPAHATLHGDTSEFDPLTRAWTTICTKDSIMVLPPHAHEGCAAPAPNGSSTVSLAQMKAMAGEARACTRPYPRTMAAAVLYRNCMYVFGGRDRRQSFACPFFLPLPATHSLQRFVLQYILEQRITVDPQGLPAPLARQLRSASP